MRPERVRHGAVREALRAARGRSEPRVRARTPSRATPRILTRFVQEPCIPRSRRDAIAVRIADPMTNSRLDTELLLTNLGTPTEPTPEAVRAFLDEFLSDPLVVDWPRALWLPILRGIVLRKRPAAVARLYESIWTPQGSPLSAQTRRLARAVDADLGDAAAAAPAYRYGVPSLADTIRAAASRAERVVVVPLFPQRTASSSGSVEAEVARVATELGGTGRVRCAAIEPDDPGYVEALRDRVATTFAAAGAAPDHLLVSFHGIPARVDAREHGRYRADCERTTVALLDALDWEPSRATLAYQSKFGPGRWLEPATAERITALARQGVRRLGVVAPGFLTDGLETLEELGVRGREDFLAAGGEDLYLVPAVADHPALRRTLARLAGRSAGSGAV